MAQTSFLARSNRRRFSPAMERIFHRIYVADTVRQCANEGILVLGEHSYEFSDPGYRLGKQRDLPIGRRNRLSVLRDFYDDLEWFGHEEEATARRLRFVSCAWEDRFSVFQSAQDRIASVRTVAMFFMTNLASTKPFPFPNAVRCLEQDDHGQHVLIRMHVMPGFEIYPGLDIDRSPDILLPIETNVAT